VLYRFGARNGTALPMSYRRRQRFRALKDINCTHAAV
jgi:hypothetical protein